MLLRDVTVVNGMVRTKDSVRDTDYSQYSDEALQQLLDTMPPGTPKYVIDEIKKEIERRDKKTKDAFSESARKAALEARRRKMKSKGEIQKNPRGEKKEKESSGLFEKLREDPEWQKVLRLREKAMSEDFKGNISAANELRKQVSEILKNHELYQKWVKEEMGNQRGEVSSKKLTDEIKKDPGKTQAYLFDKVSELLPEGDIDTMSQHDSLYVVITPNNDSPEEIKKIEQIAKQAMKGFDGEKVSGRWEGKGKEKSFLIDVDGLNF